MKAESPPKPAKDTDNFKDADTQASSSAAATSNGCHCMQYWVALEEENNAELYLPGSFVRADYLLDILRCKENPGIASLIEQLPTPVLNITEEVLKSASCSTQDYCGRVFSDTYPKWCYTETRSMPEGEQQRMCSNNRWLWCDAGVQDYVPASWRFVPGATIIGNLRLLSTALSWSFQLKKFNRGCCVQTLHCHKLRERDNTVPDACSRFHRCLSASTLSAYMRKSQAPCT